MEPIRSLTGIRAICIAAVIIGHLSGTPNFPVLSKYFVGDYANLGVQVFFVLSGFLITSLLAREFKKTGRISIREFWLRRAIRIFPASLVYLIVVAILAGFNIIRLAPYDLLFAFSYTMNYASHPSWFVGHLWSLSVEEQFYILWPPVVAIFNVDRGAWFAAGGLLLAPFVRLYLHLHRIDLEIFPAVLDGMAIGCLMAIYRDKLITKDWYLRWTSGPVVATLIVLIFAINRLRGYSVVDSFLLPVMLIAVAICIDWSIRSTGRVATWLNTAHMQFIGAMSYSLYLWQQLFLVHRTSQSIPFPANLILACGASYVSYRFIETPIRNYGRSKLRLGHQSKPSMDLPVSVAETAVASAPRSLR